MRVFRRACLVLVVVLGGCGGKIDWSGPENFLLRERATNKDDGVLLEYWSLVDAPAGGVYDALADVEHYPAFVPGVDSVSVIAVDGDGKTVQIAQRVIGRQANARVKWRFQPDRKRVEFTTLASNLNRNDGFYEVEPSPDGKRALVHSSFLVRPGEGSAQAVPIGVLTAGTRESFLAAAKGVRTRASGGTATAAD